MRTVQRDLLVLGTLVLLGTLALTGCTPEPAPRASETTAPTDAPVFASDEEALAAATEAYAAYLRTSDEISAAGGVGAERMETLVSTDVLKSELEGFKGFADADARTVGATSFIVHSMKSARYLRPEQTSISLYVCEDVTGLDVIDSMGISLVSASRQPVTPFEVLFQMDAGLQLILEDRSVWRGESFC
jgi:Na+-transporting methylmalonyl-CoA/oxaloacetate decarboxylase gamma subunit